MGTANFTKINFTLNELLHLIARVEIKTFLNGNKDISFPRIERKSEEVEQKHTQKSLPNDEELLNMMKKAKSEALKKAAEFEFQISESEIEMCRIEASESSIEADYQDDEEEVDYQRGLLEQFMASGETTHEDEAGILSAR